MGSIIFLVVMVVAMYAIIILPQQRKQKQKQALLRSLEAGDEVITSSGIYGTVVELDSDVVFLDIGDGFEIRLTREAVEHVIRHEAEPDDQPDDEADEEIDEQVDQEGPIS